MRIHTVVNERLYCDSCFADNCDAMCECYLTPISQMAQPGEIKDWSIGGALFLDYCEMNHRYEQVEQVLIVSSSMFRFSLLSSISLTVIYGSEPGMSILCTKDMR